ncbi:uncharacterized protein LOC135130682 [Zophobas morio]|uniref:uncharacterized protein LOC135130682 n=1 Tax=Zophobas morio TaxID=2755281 RepID=UPI0030836D13
MWTTSFAVAVNLFVCAIVAVPTQNDVVKSFQAAVHQQDLQSILTSIEERLRNLDTIYSIHLSQSFEEKLEQYQRKLESIDTKIIRLETLAMLNLDKISENISTKNFKDDIARTNLAKKVDAVYEGISHRLNYMDRKLETSSGKLQGKLEAALTRLERMDESFTTRNEEIEIELSDALAAIDDLKTSYGTMEENIVNNTDENFEISLKEQMLLMKSFNDKSNQAIQALYENTTRGFDRIERKIGMGLDAINETDRFLKGLKLEVKRELNEYAIKVAEMNSENWKTGNVLENKQSHLEIMINSTKTEVQNGMRALMLLIGKISNKEHLPQADESQIEKLKENIDANFEKVFSAQNLFMDSCYRLQMDESQIESKISDILEKLIETFDKKTAVETKDIKNLEKIIKSHDAHITRSLYQTSTNVVTIFGKMSEDHRQFETDLKQVSDHLNALFSLIQDTLADENGSLSSKNVNLLLNDLKEMEKKITSLYKQGDVLTNSVGEIKGVVEALHRGNSSRLIDEYFKNISQVIAGMEAKINTVYLYYYFNRSRIDAINQNLAQELRQVLDVVSVNDSRGISETNVTGESRVGSLEEKISEIFGQPEANDTRGSGAPDNCAPNLLNAIDVRSGSDCENNTPEGINRDEMTTETLESTVKTSGSDDYQELDTTWQQVLE